MLMLMMHCSLLEESHDIFVSCNWVKWDWGVPDFMDWELTDGPLFFIDYIKNNHLLQNGLFCCICSGIKWLRCLVLERWIRLILLIRRSFRILNLLGMICIDNLKINKVHFFSLCFMHTHSSKNNIKRKNTFLACDISD